MELRKKDLQTLRRVRDRERLSMRILFTIIAVLREKYIPWVDPGNWGGVCQWFAELPSAEQTRMIDEAMGVDIARQMGVIK